ncbi:MAG: UDP-N-acetylmuramoyl-tripeptide--D-alanyl-D-alanine ligase [Sulfuritalea sp.]|nr:UDP-N-acetylmuramoyl-tripeptide--D-alanyl-D-alanine ligase [Sulfuritalea sp.]
MPAVLTTSAATLILNGTHTGHEVEFTGVGTDSRALMPGMLFVALKGERCDGHDFVPAALAQGASCALVGNDWAAAHADLPLIGVADTRLALGQLGAHWRTRFHIPLIGVTGSNGKTTVKEMCAAILRADLGQHAVLATQGNLNNDIGVPLTLLRLHAPHRAAVIEMGMNHPGEIAVLTRLAQPTVALVNNAQRAHLEGLGSVEAIARAKGEIFAGLGERGVAVINADDPHAALWRGLNRERRSISFGFAPGADVRGVWQPRGVYGLLELDTPHGRAAIDLQVPGAHNARNALAAAAACLAAGVPLTPVVRGLSGYAGMPGRLQNKRGAGGATVIDDSYNANPDSMRAAIDVLAARPGKRILVIGDMGEIGALAGQLHDEIGAYAKSQGIDQLFSLGEKSAAATRNFGAGALHCKDLPTLVKALLPHLDPDTTVLVKGSRFMGMERAVEAIAAKEGL